MRHRKGRSSNRARVTGLPPQLARQSTPPVQFGVSAIQGPPQGIGRGQGSGQARVAFGQPQAAHRGPVKPKASKAVHQAQPGNVGAILDAMTALKFRRAAKRPVSSKPSGGSKTGAPHGNLPPQFGKRL